MKKFLIITKNHPIEIMDVMYKLYQSIGSIDMGIFIGSPQFTAYQTEQIEQTEENITQQIYDKQLEIDTLKAEERQLVAYIEKAEKELEKSKQNKGRGSTARFFCQAFLFAKTR